VSTTVAGVVSRGDASGVTRDPVKQAVSDLAVCGGAPLFADHRYVGRPNLPDRAVIHRYVDEILDRNWLTNAGPVVTELEDRLARILGVEHCVATCNGTVALEIATRALGLTGEVIVPSFTFVGTAHALQWQEITPVFCDIDPLTHTIDPKRIESLITPRTTGIIGVHLWGRACAVAELDEIAQRHGLRVVYDAAHAFACTHQGRPIGGFGNAEIFSFHATKFFNTLEGGAIATNDAELANRARLMKNFGFTYYDEVVHVGANGKMNEVAAAFGLAGLDRVDEVIERNHANYLTYCDVLDGIPGIRLLPFDDTEKRNYQYVVVELDEGEFGLTRDEVVVALHRENVIARRYFYPGCHRLEPYRSYFPNAGLLLPETTAVASRVICLPTGAAMHPGDIARLGGLLAQLHEWSPALRAGQIDASALQHPPYGDTRVTEPPTPDVAKVQTR
jgi:dTDP-4-amino-4,6-dideoxygalactose transaminase